MEKIKITSCLKNLALILLTIIIIGGCKKDSDPEENPPPAPVNPLVGTYTFIAATFNAPITVILLNGDTTHYEAGDDAYPFVGGGLLGAAPCDNADVAALELRADFTSWYVCLGESNESQQGTWEPVNDNTILKLNISDPADFVVNIIDIDLSNDKLTGNIPALPMPYDASLPVGEPLPGGGINFQVAKVSVEFNQVK